MPMRTYQLLLHGIAALCVAQALIAQEKIAILAVVLDPSAPIEDSASPACKTSRFRQAPSGPR
jgi:hypothetical protein